MRCCPSLDQARSVRESKWIPLTYMNGVFIWMITMIRIRIFLKLCCEILSLGNKRKAQQKGDYSHDYLFSVIDKNRVRGCHRKNHLVRHIESTLRVLFPRSLRWTGKQLLWCGHAFTNGIFACMPAEFEEQWTKPDSYTRFTPSREQCERFGWVSPGKHMRNIIGR